MEQSAFKAIGIYAVIILALVRFMVYPLHDAGAKKQLIFNELYETYQLKVQQAARQALDKDKRVKILTDKEVIGRSIYERGMPFSVIQADVLENILKIVEKNGLTVQSLEMPEPITGKTISDVPVLVRLTGKPETQINFLKTVLSDGRIMLVKSLDMSKGGNDISLAMTIITFRMEK